MPCSRSGGSTGVKVQNSAANSVPARLAASTIAHSRAIRQMLTQEMSLNTGSTTVMVLSVNSCWFPSTTIRKPTQ